jgi:dolichyl-phosphate beta-glucosyltransferase
MNRFPDLETTPATIELSLVVPSYNEENRLPKMMDETMRYLKKRAAADPSFTYELVIVDDGSKDKTYQVCAWLAPSSTRHARC